MAGYAVVQAEGVRDVLGDYPGEMRLFTAPAGAEQVALTYRRMPARTGGKGGYGHRHKTQEEIYFVVSGRLQVKLDDDVLDVGSKTAIRVSPEVARSLWNDGPDDAEVVIVSRKIADPRADIEMVEDFWPT